MCVGSNPSTIVPGKPLNDFQSGCGEIAKFSTLLNGCESTTQQSTTPASESDSMDWICTACTRPFGQWSITSTVSILRRQGWLDLDMDA